MEKTSYPFNLRSHPNRLLKDHALGVLSLGKAIFDRTEIHPQNYEMEKLKQVVEQTCLLHDFGKASQWFQKYIARAGGVQTVSSRERALRRHGLISAVLVFGILNDFFPEEPKYAIFGFIVVRKHHGNLENWDDLLTIESKDWDILRQQTEGIDYKEYRAIIHSFPQKELINKAFVLKTMDLMETGASNFFRLRRRIKKTLSAEDYMLLNYLYSVLLTADKADAVFAGKLKFETEDRLHISASQIERFKEKHFENKSHFDRLRTEIFQTVKRAINRARPDQRVYSLNTPTGSGKTIASLYGASLLREKFGLSRIIYCLPFTSVIDQNYDVFEDIIRHGGLTPHSGLLLKHHHLVDLRYTILDDKGDDKFLKEYDIDGSIFFIEGWESNLIVTTFVQLFYTLITNLNGSLRKFHKIAGSVIILDEIQSIPHRYWKVIHDILLLIVRHLNVRIILVTATMPLIFSERENEILELIHQKRKIFNGMSRIELDVSALWNKENELFYYEWQFFLEEMTRLVKHFSDKNILIVMNTISTARELFFYLRNEDNRHELIYLSSHVLPKDRLKRIEFIKKHQGNPVLLVSTQLVEAGVDLDFDIVVRDMAPLDSIFQVCGRCNRNNTGERIGKVYLYAIKNKENRKPSSIYDPFLLEKTIKVFKNKELVKEEHFLTLAEKYYNEVKIYHSEQKSIEIWNAIQSLSYQDLIQEHRFELIDDTYSASVFVEIDSNAQKLWQEYQELLMLERSFENNALLKKKQRLIAAYIINVPKKCLPDVGGIYRILYEEIEQFYDSQTGFKPDSQLPERTETMML